MISRMRSSILRPAGSGGTIARLIIAASISAQAASCGSPGVGDQDYEQSASDGASSAGANDVLGVGAKWPDGVIHIWHASPDWLGKSAKNRVRSMYAWSIPQIGEATLDGCKVLDCSTFQNPCLQLSNSSSFAEYGAVNGFGFLIAGNQAREWRQGYFESFGSELKSPSIFGEIFFWFSLPPDVPGRIWQMGAKKADYFGFSERKGAYFRGWALDFRKPGVVRLHGEKLSAQPPMTEPPILIDDFDVDCVGSPEVLNSFLSRW